MKCKRCKKECMESELNNGYCYECYQKYKDDITELKNVNNEVADTIKKISKIIKILGYLGSVILLFVYIYVFSFLSGIIFTILEVFTIIVATTLLDGFAEIIQLLENIKNK